MSDNLIMLSDNLIMHLCPPQPSVTPSLRGELAPYLEKLLPDDEDRAFAPFVIFFVH